MVNGTSIREITEVSGSVWYNHDDRDAFGMIFNEYLSYYKKFPYKQLVTFFFKNVFTFF